MDFLFFGGKLFAHPYWWVKKHLLGHNYKSYKEAIRRLNTPLDIQCFMFSEFKYISDEKPEDEWQEPKVTWDRKGGDCEDWALFALECLKDPKAFILSFHPNTFRGHATCVLQEGKESWITMGTFGLRRIKGPIEAIPNKWYKDWVEMLITRKDGTETWIHRGEKK